MNNDLSGVRPIRAMILAAGRGKRLRPLTDSIPKPLVELNGKPLIEYHLEKLARVGVKDVVINHAWLGHKIESVLGDGSRWQINIHYSAEPEGGLETAGGIVNALPMLGHDPFLVINGDIYTHYDFGRLVAVAANMQSNQGQCNNRRLAHLVLVENPTHNPAGDFDVDSNGIVFDRKGYTFAGMSVLCPELFDDVDLGFAPLAPVLRRAIQLGAVSGERGQDFWSDIGTIERLNQTESWLRNRCKQTDSKSL